MKPRVLLISSVHPATDSRIVYKIGPSLVPHYEVMCAIPNAEIHEDSPDIRFITLPYFRNLFLRLLITHPLILCKCLFLRPEVVHIFLPELIPLGFLFKWLGANVIYEVQENMFKKFEIKRSNNALIYQWLFRFFDQLARKKLHLILTEEAYLTEYQNLKHPYAVVRNYVSIPFIDQYAGKYTTNNGDPVFFYTGVISMERCLDTLVAALVLLKNLHPQFQVYLFGPLRLSLEQLRALPGYEAVKQHIKFFGYTDLKILLPYARKSIAGIALLKPVADYAESYPTKLFEYMALNLPVIASDFPLYKEVIQNADCGVCISPYDATRLCEEMDRMIRNPVHSATLGNNGRNAAVQYYNWQIEEKVLLSFYQQISSGKILKN